MNIIEKMCRARVLERSSIIQSLYEKNCAFFKKTYPEIYKFIQEVSCPYHIDITQDFLNIIDDSTGQPIHGGVDLANFTEMLGDWSHEAWIDFCNLIMRIPDQKTQHGRLVAEFNEKIGRQFKDVNSYIYSENTNLKNITREGDNVKFSPPVVFAGIFHGLHIAYYLSRSEVTDILMIEPEPERFLLSCYFLDYEKISQETAMYLVIGQAVPANILARFMAWYRITPFIWLRILPGYASPAIEPVISAIRLWQVQHFSITHAFDIDLRGMQNSLANLDASMPILTEEPKISDSACIVVVGAGPSLDSDIGWIKRHQGNMLIFAVHSAVKVLRKHDIRPDFQFAIDIHLDNNTLESLQLYRDVPLVTLVKAGNEYSGYVDTVLMVEDIAKAQPVKFFKSLKHIYPSTGNMTLAMALLCRPAHLYLAGLDFGYKRHDYRHASGEIFDAKDSANTFKNQENERDLFVVNSNFGNVPEILSNPFYNLARTVAEVSISECTDKTVIFNLSDGAFISGTIPARSVEIKLPRYTRKREDCSAIINSFKPAEQGLNWIPYPSSGKKCIEEMKDCIFEVLRMKSFDWKVFSNSIGSVMPEIMKQVQGKEHDVRMEVYYKLIADFMLSFYRFIIVCDEKEQAAVVYKSCYQALKDILTQLEWPDELDVPSTHDMV